MKHKRTFFNPVGIITHLIAAYFKRMVNITHLIRLETKLAVKTLVQITILAYIMSLLLFATWLSILSMLFIYLISLRYTMLTASFIITIINIALILIISYFILKKKRNLTFPATRRQLGIAKRDSDV